MTEDDFQYAVENTKVILAPEQQIATFGSTSFRFYLISELMDRVNEIRDIILDIENRDVREMTSILKAS